MKLLPAVCILLLGRANVWAAASRGTATAARGAPTTYVTNHGYGVASMPLESTQLPVRVDPDSNPKKTAALYQLPKETQQLFTRSFQAAVGFGNKGDYASAIAQYDVVNRIFPGYIESHTNLAVCLERTGRDPEAEQVLQRAVTMFPGEYLPADNLCTLRIKSLHDGSADALPTCLLALKNAEGMDEAEASLHLKLASLLTETADYTLSHHHFRSAMQLRPAYSDIMHNYACSLTRAKQYKLAAEIAARGAQLHPGDVRHTSNAGTVKLYSSRHDATAVRRLQRGLELFVGQQPVEPTHANQCNGVPFKVRATGQLKLGALMTWRDECPGCKLGVKLGQVMADNGRVAANASTNYQCGTWPRGGASPCGQHSPLQFTQAEVRVAKLENKYVEGEGGLVYDECKVYSLHHQHSENFQDQLVRMQRAAQDPSPQSIQLHRLHSKPVLSLIQHNLRNHYHWLLEALPRLLIGLRHLEEQQPKSSFQILVPWEAGINGVMRQSLELILTPEQMLQCQFYHHAAVSSYQRIRYHVKQLHVVHWHRPNAEVHEQDGWSIYHPPREAIRMVHNEVLAAVNEIEPLEHEQQRVLYVSRKLATFRKVQGEDLLIEGLRRLVSSKNLQVHFGNETLIEQIRMFHHAHLVIGAHGSGLANTVFCKPGTVVLQFPLWPDLLSSSVAHIAAALDLHFWTAPKITAHHFQDYEINNSNLAPLIELVYWARQNNVQAASKGCPNAPPEEPEPPDKPIVPVPNVSTGWFG